MTAPEPLATPNWTWLALPPGTRAEPIARAWLGHRLGCPGDALPIERDPHGRPHLGRPWEGFDCNWSHSGDGLLVALGEGVRVGIDLEWPRPRSRAMALARRFFDPAEADWLAGLAEDARQQAFLRLWCAKEAVLKAHGRGVSFGLDRLRFVDTPAGLRLATCDPALGAASGWSLRELLPAPGYVGALAWTAQPSAADRA